MSRDFYARWRKICKQMTYKAAGGLCAVLPICPKGRKFLKGLKYSMTNKEQFKRLIVFFASLVIIFCVSMSFSFVWHNLYNTHFGEKIGETYFFWQKGNFLLVCVYMLVYAIFSKSFNGFRIGYLKTGGLIGSQILGLIATNAVTYLQISLLGRLLPTEFTRHHRLDVGLTLMLVVLDHHATSRLPVTTS